MSTFQRFVKTSAIYFSGNILSKVISFILLPIYTNYIIPIQYGEYDLVIAFINLLVPIAFYQIWDGMFRFAFDASSEEYQYKIISNSFLISLSGIILYVLFSFLVNHFLTFNYFIESLIYGILFGYQNFFSFTARIFLKNQLFVISGIANTIITFILNIVFIVFLRFDIVSLYIASSIGCLIQILLIESKLHIMTHISLFNINKDLCKKMLKFSIPLCIATVSYWLLSGFTKLSITEKLGAFENGQYAVALKFASTITIIVNVFQYAWNEIAYMMSHDENRNLKYEKSIDLLSKSVFIGAAVICILIKWIFPYFVAKDYYSSYNLIPISILGVAFNTIAGFIGTFFMMEKKTVHILSTTVCVSIINCGLCMICIEQFGIFGPTCLLSLSFLILMVFRLVIIKNKFHIKYQSTNLISLLVLGIAIYDYYVINNIHIDIFILMFSIMAFIILNKKYILLILNRVGK